MCTNCDSTTLPEVTNTEVITTNSNGVNFKGIFNTSNSYSVNNLVFFQGSTYISTGNTSGSGASISPPNAPWQIFAQGGSQGLPGVQGNYGGISFRYMFSTGNSASDPGTGFIKFDNSDSILAANIYISKTDASGGNSGAIFPLLAVNATLQIFDINNPDLYVLYKVTSVASHSGWETLVTTYLAGTLQLSLVPSTFINNQNTIVSFGAPTT